jgi:hypothetical protein
MLRCYPECDRKNASGKEGFLKAHPHEYQRSIIVNTHDNFRPTIGVIVWFWGGAALVAALLVGLAAGMALARQSGPSVQAPVALAGPDTSRGSGSAYDGSAYVEYLTPRMPIDTPSSVAPNPNRPVIGTGSAYDGGAYSSVR